MWRPLLCLLAVGLADAVAAQPVLQIHEVVSNNATSALDEDGDASDWIEVANLGTEAVDLAGIALSDDPDRPRRWVFPSGTLAPGGIVLVFASGKDRASSVLHTSFRLRAEGETLTLTAADGQRLDTVDLPTLPADVSFGRDPAGDWVYFSPPTPGVLNGTGATRIASRPTLVPAPGRHDGPVEVVPEAGHPEEMLRYTRDGSIPTDTSPEVTGPIILSQNGLVRVRAFREGRLPGPVRTGTYLIGEPRDLPAVALAVDPVDLYSRASGVFNLFNLYQDLEAAAHLALIDAEADIPDLDANVGLRLHGGFSRRYPQKSVALFARERYGTEAITGALFPDRPREAYQAVVLRNSGQDWYFSMMRDGLMQTLVSGLDVDVQSYRPMAAYLNGAYWGLLNLRERTNEHYLAMRHGVDPDAIDLFQILWGHETPEVIQGDLQPFLDLLTFVEARDPLTEADLAVVAEAVDLGSYIDYHAAQLYFNNRDWPGNNVKVWRPGTPGARWRWALFDTDTGFGYFGPEDAEMNTLAFATDPNGQTQTNLPRSTLLLRRLLSAETFRDRFASRFADLLNGPFRPDSVVATVDRLAVVIAPEIPRHRARWPPSAPDWEDQIETLRDFGRRRPASVREHLRDGLGLGAPMPLTIRTRGAGYVRLGTLGAVNGDWTGTYFSGLRVEVEAIPAVGMRFVCWSDGSTSRLRRVDPGAVSELEARFEAAAPGGASVVVNEIQYNPPDDADSEDWVELLNTGEVTVDLSGWVLSDEDDDDQAELPAGTSLAPGGYLVLCRDPDAFAQIHPSAAPCLGGWDFGLSGGGDQVRLFDASGALRDSVAYDDAAPWPTAPDGDGATLELFSSDLDNADASSWRASSVRGGTPGAFNSVAVDAEPVPAPNRLSLATPFPNPFRTPTSIQFVLPSRGGVDLRLFDALGREVARLAEEDRAEGPHAVSLDVPGLAPGVYLVRLRTEAGTLARRVTKVE